MESTIKPRCRHLILDAGPLLSLSPLRGLAETFVTVPQVLAELKDSRAREHFEKLGLLSGVRVVVKSPDAASLAHTIQWARKTGDYSVLSHADICVLALTHSLQTEAMRLAAQEELSEPSKVNEGTSSLDVSISDPIEGVSKILHETTIQVQEALEPETKVDENKDQPQEPLGVEFRLAENENSVQSRPELLQSKPSELLYEDPSDSDDGEGEWITPDNVGVHKSRALDLLPDIDEDRKRSGKEKGKATQVEQIAVGCMTADFAMQNVLLQMGLNLVGLEGKRIQKVKSWVLRCHACFKICKDNSKKFCPSCGNPTLLRASVTVAAPGTDANAPAMQIHLKSNFQYKIRGTKFSIPNSKSGTSKTGTGDGLILREDQVEYMRAKKRADGKRQREETKMTKGILTRGVEGNSVGVSSWMDPDWMPEMIIVGSGGKGRTSRSSRMDGDLPQIGYGRKNPNESRKKKK
ncbi:Nin one binding Zn-ribbon like-domain-containing protein [Cyathus striatus]|nr:Nin one binding Zn-ribbon like-domain-containing protein [Cyathus striatus]